MMENENSEPAESLTPAGGGPSGGSQPSDVYRTVADSNYDWTYWLAPGGEMLYTSPSCQRITGYSREAFARNPRLLEEIVHPDDRPLMIDHSHAPFEEDEPQPVDFRILRADGEERWISRLCQPVYDAAGKAMGICASNRDITALKQTELALEKALARSQQFEMAVNHSRSMVFRWRAQPDFPVEFVSENVAQLGYEADGFLSGRVSWVGITHPDDVPRLVEELDEYAGRGLDEFPMEYRLLDRDGNVHWMADQTRALRGTDGHITHYESVILDVTERRRVEQQREEMLSREQRIAEVLQKALVPDALREVPGAEIAASYEASLSEAQVGGDFYDVFSLGCGKTGILIGDVAGKGLGAAIRVAAARHTIRSYAYLDPRPGRIMTLTNDALCREEAGVAPMLTAFLAVVDTNVGAMSCANGGHEAPLLREAEGRVTEIEAQGRLLGVQGAYDYHEYSRRLWPGDTLVMYTDGVSEARTSGPNTFGTEGILAYLDTHGHETVQEIADGLLQAAKRHAGGSLKDDAAIVVFRMRG